MEFNKSLCSGVNKYDDIASFFFCKTKQNHNVQRVWNIEKRRDQNLTAF